MDSTNAPQRPAVDPQRPDQSGATVWGTEDDLDTPTARKVKVVHRIGALVVAAVLAVFGLLGLLGGLEYFSTDGDTVVGLSSNGLLSTISLLTGAVLVASALRGGRQSGVVMIGFGVAFLLSAFWHLFVLNTSLNVLAFSMANVIFSIVTGIVLLTLGLYGRVSGNLPADNPYHLQTAGNRETDADEEPELPPSTPAERRAEREIREAEVAVAERRATPEQTRRVEAMSRVRTKVERRRIWMEHTGR
ncbi:DUF4383 domain-containing protein [Geodermatophilus sp. Leaf369]|uniref:DUF4383 domain-containing protein n=1 Tax=Geodermatophilus sp. Leaf369 TaxID=1736354 RepID=UPI0009E68A57|nr:DUF4383 domain-containing protein [Geodermatophilus sp. Leaf369]